MPATNYYYQAPGEQDYGESNMYAVIVTGGKQYKVAEGEYLRVEKLEAETGSTVEFDRVLLVGNGDDVTIGAPVVEGAKVTAEVSADRKSTRLNSSHVRISYAV